MMKAALGIDIGGTHIKTGIMTTSGKVYHWNTVSTEANNGAEALMVKLHEIIKSAQNYCTNHNLTLCGIGVGTAGQVHVESGRVAGATSNLPGWAGIHLSERLKAETGFDILVDNDVNMIAMGELLQGAGKDWNDFICVALGTGIGGCHIINRRIYHGRDGYAGEFGHQIVQMDGIACNCGNRGCWEQYASVTALKRLIAGASENVTFNDPISLFSAAVEGNPNANLIVDKYAGYISVGLISLIHANNPKAIVLGGAIMNQGEFLLERIRKQVSERIMRVYQYPEMVNIVPAALGEKAGIIGAAGSNLIRAGFLD